MTKKSVETRLSLIEQAMSYNTKKLDSIHEKLVGNGKVGIVDELNQFKGALKGTQILFGIIITLITLAILIINFWKGG